MRELTEEEIKSIDSAIETDIAQNRYAGEGRDKWFWTKAVVQDIMNKDDRTKDILPSIASDLVYCMFDYCSSMIDVHYSAELLHHTALLVRGLFSTVGFQTLTKDGHKVILSVKHPISVLSTGMQRCSLWDYICEYVKIKYKKEIVLYKCDKSDKGIDISKIMEDSFKEIMTAEGTLFDRIRDRIIVKS